MKRGDAFPSRYLAKDDLSGPVVAKIADVQLEHLPGTSDDELKPVVLLEGGLKPLVCNQTNWGILESAYGPESDDWHGRRIEVYVDETVYFGAKRVGGLRVRIPDQGRPQPSEEPGAGEDAPISATAARARCARAFNEAYLQAEPEATKEQIREAWTRMVGEAVEELGVKGESEISAEGWGEVEAAIAEWLSVPF